jgi:hypothetical protein
MGRLTQMLNPDRGTYNLREGVYGYNQGSLVIIFEFVKSYHFYILGNLEGFYSQEGAQGSHIF